MKGRFARSWYKFKNWFRTKPGPGEPLTFLCGSEEELRRVTTWTCHACPQVFQNRSRVVIGYQATNDSSLGGGELYWGLISSDEERVCMETCCEWLLPWLALVFKYNTFTGTQWTRRVIIEKYILSTRDGKPAGWSFYWEQSLCIVVRIHPPSAHERAEALLALSEWLDGKVSEEEKRELLQLPDDVTV